MHPEPTVNKSQTDPKKTQATLSKPCKKKATSETYPKQTLNNAKGTPQKSKSNLKYPLNKPLKFTVAKEN